MRWLVVIAVAGSGLACARAPADSPEAAWRAFAIAVRKGDARGAYAALSPATREKIEARARAIAAASGGVIKNEPALMFFQSGTRPAPMGDVKRLSADDAVAVLEVGVPGGSQQVKLVRDSGRWLVDLSDTPELRGAP